MANVGQFILDNLLRDPDDVMQIDGRTGEAETRKSVRTRAIRVAAHMKKLGMGVGDIATFCLYNTNDTCLPFIASFCLGVAVSPLDMSMSVLEYEYILNIIQPKMLFCEESAGDKFKKIVEKLKLNTIIVVFGDNKNFLNIKEFYADEYKGEFEVSKFDPATTNAYILCSSGSTGLPKGVCHTHNQSLQTVKAITGFFNGYKMVQFSSLYWLSGIAMALLNVCIKTEKVNAPPFNVDLFFDYLTKYKSEFFVVTPSVVRMIIKDSRFETFDFSYVKIVMVSGAPIDISELDKFQAHLPIGKVVNSYGLTEIGGPVTYTDREHGFKNGACGKIIPYIQYKLIDNVTGEVHKETNRRGELYLKASCMMESYYKNPEATKEAMDADGWFRTGDLVEIDDDGYLHIVDRLKEVFKYMGFCIAPAGIEHVINKHPGVIESAVIGIDDKDSGHIPVAFVKRKVGCSVTAQEIKDLVKANLAYYCELRGGVIFVDSFEMTPSGKVKKTMLKEMLKTVTPE